MANTALVAVAVFNGVALGSQPLISESYGKHNIKDIKLIEKLGVATALGLAVIIVIMIWGFTDTIVGVFNSQGSDRLLSLARVGLRIYFIGFLFAGINIFCSSALSAMASVKWALVLSILKGFVVVNVCAAILAPIFGMNGVWLAFPLSEFILLIISGFAMKKSIGALESER